MRLANLYLLAFVLLASAACNRTLDPVHPHTDFIFPNHPGKTRIYTVTDTSWETTNPQGFEIQNYFRKEETGGAETDLMGRTVSKLFTYTRPDSANSEFVFDELWTQYKDEETAERIEGNDRYVVLKFPAYKGVRWDGNAYNEAEPETYTYLNTDTTVTVAGQTYEHCVFVLQVPFSDPGVPGGYRNIEHAYEIYAPDIGKIYSYRKHYRQNGPGDVFAWSFAREERLVEFR